MATWSGKVAAVRIWATSASGYSAMGATKDWSSAVLLGADSVGFPLYVAGAEVPVCPPYKSCDEAATKTKLRTTDNIFFMFLVIIRITPRRFHYAFIIIQIFISSLRPA